MREFALILVFLPWAESVVCPEGGRDCGSRECCVRADAGYYCCGGDSYPPTGWIQVNWTPLIIGLVISIVVSIILSILCCIFCNGCFLHRWRNPDRYQYDDGFSMFPFGVMVSPVPPSWVGGRRESPPSYASASPQPLSDRGSSPLDHPSIDSRYLDQPPSSYTSSLQRNRVHFSDDDPYETQVKSYEMPKSVLKHH